MPPEDEALEAEETEESDVSLEESGEEVFDEAFDEALGDKSESSEESSEGKKEDKKEEEAKPEEDEGKAEEEEKDEGKTKSEEEEEEEEEEEKDQEAEDKKDKDEGDEDLTPAQKRGKTLIEAEGGGEEEEDEDLEEAPRTPTQPPPIEQIDDRVAGAYIGMLDPTKLPESLKIGEEVINLKAYYEDNPEVPIVTTLMARQIISRLVDAGILMTGNQADEMMEETNDRIYKMRLTQEWPDTDMEEVIDSKEFAEWVQKSAPKEVQALFRSDDHEDHILGFREYFDASPAKKTSKEKASKADTKARKTKADFDALHTSSLKRTSKKAGGGGLEEGFDDTFAEAADKVEKENM